MGHPDRMTAGGPGLALLPSLREWSKLSRLPLAKWASDAASSLWGTPIMTILLIIIVVVVLPSAFAVLWPMWRSGAGAS